MTRPGLAAEWQRIRTSLLAVARPDSRFDLDLDGFIPAFEGIERATARAISTAGFDAAKLLFVTPDNSIQPLRHRALAEGKTLLVPSYGLRRGFLRVGPGSVPPDLALYASWGDGIQHFGKPLPFEDLAPEGPVDLVVAGAAAVARNGLRFGMGHGYLDVEWNMFYRARSVSDATPVWTIVHDCQVLDQDVPGDADSVLAENIFTPTRTISAPMAPKPRRLREATLTMLFGRDIESLGLRQVVDFQHLDRSANS